MALSCLIEFNDNSLRRNLSEYFGLSLGLARFILAMGSLCHNKCYSLFLPNQIDYTTYFECRINDSISFGENEYLLILSKLLAEGKLQKSNLLRLIKAREFDCSKKPFDSYEQQIEYIRDTSQNLLFMGLSCLIEFNDNSLRKNLSEYFGLSLGLARFVLAAGSLSQNKCYSLFLPTGIDYSTYFEGRINDNISGRIRSDIDLTFNLFQRGKREIKSMGLKKNILSVLNTVNNFVPILKEIKNNPQLIYKTDHKPSFKAKFFDKINKLVE